MSFDLAYARTMAFEGEYDNDPVDVGGETYRGIARKFSPYWSGWSLVDRGKADPSFPANLRSDTLLADMVKEHYLNEYWRAAGCPDIDEMSPDLAAEVYDTAVNMGVKRSVGFLQRGLNFLNRNQRDYPDITADGVWGSMTFTALRSHWSRRGPKMDTLLKIVNILQGAHYCEYMIRDPRQERFAYGWLSRVEITKT